MIISRKLLRWFVLPLAIVMLGAAVTTAIAAPPNGSGAQAAGDVVVSDKQPATPADPFAVPNGTPQEILDFVEKVAHPKPFASQDEARSYFSRASVSIGTAADKVLAADANDQQITDAIEWKVESLRIKGELGDEGATKQTADFLAGLKFDSRPTVSELIAKLKIASSIGAWTQLSADQRNGFAKQFISYAKATGGSPEQAGMLIEFCESLRGDALDNSVAVQVVSGLLPIFRNCKDPGMAEPLQILEGIGRRLPGQKLELIGSYLDGKPLNWESYRGKVVLIDFWATWCGPCRAEVPNVLENYRKYHDKGFDVLGISLDEKRVPVEQYMRESGVPWRTTFYAVADPQHKQEPMAEKFGVVGIPRCILVDQQGNVVSMNARGPTLSTELQRLLGGPPKSTSSVILKTEDEKTAKE